MFASPVLCTGLCLFEDAKLLPCGGRDGARVATKMIEEPQDDVIFCSSAPDTRLCSSKPCPSNATCIERGEGGYLCVCPQGYVGENCQMKQRLCLLNGYHSLLLFINRNNYLHCSKIDIYLQPLLKKILFIVFLLH